MAFIFPFFTAFLITYLLVPITRKIAFRYEVIDKPNHRKVHVDPIPLLGGLAIFIGFGVTVLLFVPPSMKLFIMFLAGSVVLLIGMVDDWSKAHGKDFPALPKLLVQIMAASILIYGGIQITGIRGFVFAEQTAWYLPHGIGILITIIWIVGIMNMLNFLDGLDGLATGIAAISAMTLFFIALIQGQEAIAILCISLLGTTLGFLKYNFHPAKIFMGDAGALFLGCILAAIAIEGAFKGATLFTLIVPLLIFGVPIFDTVYVMFRRWRENRPIHVADKGHVHHRLMKLGLNQVQAVTFIYILGICFSLLSVVIILLFLMYST
ncbi:glycosyltransferase family 4 protein [Desulfuribacillus alkaliarsenatis]|uniref:Undecaprenyl-phosphate alpha-N-acetylglucosaminyl 1-phosphate transferase n=1 Tax=Desulfuribacillus alkaliarsenatis TaxID=766136 RepID=A0A1E5G218_9FIRM|nr:MraY family glycosyltransferase [Desulfuribacillus alkaliarsenatis]OEF97030.1 undecaprenyl-phosphate alpha-N-acetylglucosaminyl 1-phosphate transferase [Desulfuribacillus alkaliarsenatis]